MLAMTVFLLLAAALLAEAVRSHIVFSRSLSRPRARVAPGNHPLPSVSVVRPIKGMDNGIAENIRAALDHGYPGEVETIFVFDHAAEPAIPVAKKVIRERSAAGISDKTVITFAGPPPPMRTGKLNAMIAGLRLAKGELVAFADSDIRQDSDSLSTLVRTLLQAESAGAAFAPVVATEPPLTAGDAGYALMFNGFYAPAAAWTAERLGGELPFIMGEFMVFKRDVIRDICGLESAEGQLVDDMYLGARVKAAGFRNVVSPRPVAVIEKGMTLAEFCRTYLRWVTFSRSGLPGREFKLASWTRGLVFWAGALAAAGAAVGGHFAASAILALAPLITVASVVRLHRSAGGAPLGVRHWPVALLIFLAAPIVYLRVFTRREVVWRGRRYRLDRHARLSTGRVLGLTECDDRRAA